MHIATCFDSRELSSGYSMKHNIATSSDSAHFGIPKKFTWKDTRKTATELLS